MSASRGLQLGIGERRIDLLVELVDDLGGRGSRALLSRCHGACLVARHEVGHGRDIRQYLLTRRGGHRKGAQLARSNVVDRSKVSG